MILSVHQPQYLPWIGYVHKIMQSDAFVFLDNVQYKKREFQNRNKILTKEGPLWLTVPVITKGKFLQKIKDVEIDNSTSWRKTHQKSIEENYSKAKYFNEHSAFLKDFYGTEWHSLSEMNINMSEYVLYYLGIKTKVLNETELDIPGEKTARLINICKKLGADVYLSGQGAKEYLDEAEFEKNNIKLVYQEFKHPEYSQVFPGFESHLTVFDLLLNHGKASADIIRAKEVK